MAEAGSSLANFSLFSQELTDDFDQLPNQPLLIVSLLVW